MTAVRGQVLRDSLLFLTAYSIIVAAVVFG
ncbi:hypothetical protein J2126_003356 [Xanthobacter flavus]|nr:hypothetical protein [Xanthobacter flavus]